jgi:MFS transporter
MAEAARRVRDHPQFLRVWASQTAGAVADQILPVTLSLYVVSHGGGAGAVATILVGRAVALIICLMVGGVVADRARRARILLFVDLLRAVVVITTLLSISFLPLAALALVTGICGAGEAFARPALRSLVPSLLPADLLERGNGLLAAVQRGAALVGALTAGALVAICGTRVALGVAAVMFVLGAAAIAGFSDIFVPPKGGSVVRDARDGLTVMRQHPWIIAVMTAVAVQLFAGTAPALTLLPVIALRDLGGGLAYGAILAATAAGALPAVVVSSRWRPTRPGVVSMIALTMYAVPPLSLAVTLPLPVTAMCFAVGGFVVELYFVYWLSALQRAVPTEMLGRVLALDQLGAFALLPVGYLLVVPATTVLGERATLLGGAAITAAAAITALVVPGVARFADPARPTTIELADSKSLAQPSN